MGRETEIEVSLKSWLDHVLIPALVRQYVQTKKDSVASSLPSDNNPSVTNANERKDSHATLNHGAQSGVERRVL